MKILLIAMVISLVLFICVFIIENKVIDQLPDTSRFKIWWRNNVVGIYSGEEDL